MIYGGAKFIDLLAMLSRGYPIDRRFEQGNYISFSFLDIYYLNNFIFY